METRHLLADDLEAAFAINEEYLTASRSEFFRWHHEDPDLFVGVFDGTSLVGICYGMDWDRPPGYVILEGIATIRSYWRSGAGSLLIQYVETNVRDKRLQAKLKQDLGAREVIFIMEKDVS